MKTAYTLKLLWGYGTHWVGNLREEKSFLFYISNMAILVPILCGNRIQRLSNNDVIIYITIWRWRVLRDDRGLETSRRSKHTMYSVSRRPSLLSGVNGGRSGCLRLVICRGTSSASCVAVCGASIDACQDLHRKPYAGMYLKFLSFFFVHMQSIS
jgi:hypothetical protein